jgi:hypothetical protein
MEKDTGQHMCVVQVLKQISICTCHLETSTYKNFWRIQYVNKQHLHESIKRDCRLEHLEKNEQHVLSTIVQMLDVITSFNFNFVLLWISL